MNKIKCPYCNSTKNTSIKEWKYNNNTTKVNQMKCSCKKVFNHYQTAKSSWTIPKSL